MACSPYGWTFREEKDEIIRKICVAPFALALVSSHRSHFYVNGARYSTCLARLWSLGRRVRGRAGSASANVLRKWEEEREEESQVTEVYMHPTIVRKSSGKRIQRMEVLTCSQT
jgi:hypothetical protein